MARCGCWIDVVQCGQVSKVAVPDKSHSSDKACFTPGQQLWAQGSWYVEPFYLLWQGKSPKDYCRPACWSYWEEPCAAIFSAFYCCWCVYGGLLILKNAPHASPEPKVAAPGRLFCPVCGSKPWVSLLGWIRHSSARKADINIIGWQLQSFHCYTFKLPAVLCSLVSDKWPELIASVWA